MASDLQTVPAPPPATAPSAGRAGRNLPAAIGVGLVMGGLVLGTLLTSPPAFLAVLLVAVLYGLFELVDQLRAHGYGAAYPPLAVGTATLVVLAYVDGRDRMVLATLLTVLALVVWRIAEGPGRLLQDLAAGMFALFYVGFMAGFAALMLAAPHGQDRVIAFVSCVVGSDVGGYTAGVIGGRHPMAPSVSPKKSWEGFAGSVVLCAAVGAVLFAAVLSAHWWQGAVFGLALAASATLGDLGESMLKRDLGIKDMGQLLPGHGGLMDRLDSLLPSAPVAWGLLLLFVPH
jgi:phosphatidate cytidylyltransferase